MSKLKGPKGLFLWPGTCFVLIKQKAIYVIFFVKLNDFLFL